MLQVAGGKWQVATGECQRTLCCVFSPIHAAFACETISTALQLRVATMGGWGNGDTPPHSAVPSFLPLAYLFYVNCFYGNTLHLYLWPAGPAPFTSN